MGDSVPKHTGPISLTDTHPRTEHLQNPTAPHWSKPQRWKSLFLRDAQAACRCNCWGSNSTPFFQMVKLIGGNLPCQGEAGHGRPHSFFHPSHIKIAQGARTGAGRDGSAFEQILQIAIVVVIQTANRDALAVALQFAAHGTVLPAVVGLDGETTIGP